MERALVVSGGGGRRGAFATGVIQALTEAGCSYTHMYGVSVGALICTLLSQYSPAEQKYGSIELSNLWRGIEGNRSIYKRWFFGRLSALWMGGMYDTSPLHKLIKAHFNLSQLQASGVKLRLGAVALGSGRYKIFTEEVGEAIPVAAMCSSAFPVAFPPVQGPDGEWYLDGGVRNITPIREALAETTGPVDVILSGPVLGDRTVRPLKKRPGLVPLGLRTIELMSDAVFVSDLASISGPDQARVRIFAPETALGDPLEFDPAGIAQEMLYGYTHTQQQLGL